MKLAVMNCGTEENDDICSEYCSEGFPQIFIVPVNTTKVLDHLKGSHKNTRLFGSFDITALKKKLYKIIPRAM